MRKGCSGARLPRLVLFALLVMLNGVLVAHAQEPFGSGDRVIRLTLLSPAGERVSGMRVVVDWGAVTDTARGDATGLAVHRRLPVRDSTIVRLERESDGAGYYAARIALAAAQLADSLAFIVVPREWHIRRGAFAGVTVTIDPVAALRRSARGGSFGRLRRDRVVGWDPEDLPVPLALLRAHGVTSRDSADFWRSVARVEDALGATFFRPAPDTEFTGRVYPAVVRVDPRLATEGLTFISWAADGEIFEGSTSFRRAADLSDPSIVGHELLHLLGFGHTAAWPSTLAANASHPLVVTAEDAAYAQLFVDLRALQVQRNAFGGLQSTLNAMSFAR